MTQIALCLGVGLVIGVIFSFLKLPVPVPHAWGGIAGLVGMFVGEKIFQLILSHRPG